MCARFVADMMEKKLARWLRILGFDTVYPDFVEDEKIMELAKREGRVLLTQDVELSGRAKRGGVQTLLIPRDAKIEEQVAFVIRELGLSWDFPASTRCPQCNGKLEVVGREGVLGNPNAPEGVVGRNGKFWLCICGKVYWEGSHWRRIENSVREIKDRIKKID